MAGDDSVAGITWRLLYSHMWRLVRDILRARMTNWSLSYQQNLASPQHGDLRMVGLVSLQFRVPTVRFLSKLDRNCISFRGPVLAVRLHHSCNVLVVQAVTAWQDSWWEERDAHLSSERVSKYLWPSKIIAKTNTLTINYLYSAT